MDLNEICRTCLGTESLEDIFLNKDDPVKYSNIIYSAIGVWIEPTDALTKKICSSCSSNLHVTIKFRKQCKESELKLIQYCGTQNNVKNSIKASCGNDDVKLKKRMKCKKYVDNLNASREHHEKDIKTESIENEYLDTDEVPLKSFVGKEKFENICREDIWPFNVDCVSGDAKVSEVNNAKAKPRIKKAIKLEKSEYKEVLENNYLKDSNGIESIEDSNTNIDILKNEPKALMKQNHDLEFCNLKNKSIEDSDSKDAGPKCVRVSCTLCSRSLSLRSLPKHMASFHPQLDSERVQCEMCDASLLANKMRRHVKLNHGDRFRCTYCKCELGSKANLIDHVKTCSSKKRRRIPSAAGRVLSECDVCHKIMQKASIRLHKAIKHAGLGPVCEHCGRRFSNNFRLYEHYRAKHGYEKFKCSNCDFQSSTQIAMKNHERRHRGEKPFVCEPCGATFHAAYLLAQHKQSHRTEKLLKGLTPYAAAHFVQLLRGLIRTFPQAIHFCGRLCEKV